MPRMYVLVDEWKNIQILQIKFPHLDLFHHSVCTEYIQELVVYYSTTQELFNRHLAKDISNK